jgi:hypothetical protein
MDAIPVWLQLVLAVAATCSTFIAAIAAWRGPISASKMVIKNQERQLRDHQKMIVLSNLMQHRYDYSHDNFAGSLNLIDIVFYDSRPVREAWVKFHAAVNDQRLQTPEGAKLRADKLIDLIDAIADDMNMDGALSSSDFNRTYYPDSAIQKFASRMASQTS